MAYITVNPRLARGPRTQYPGAVSGNVGGLGISFDEVAAKAQELLGRAQQAGGLVQQALSVAMPYYEAQVAQYRPWLYDQGQKVGRAVVEKAWATAADAAEKKLNPPPPPVTPPGPPAPPAPDWLQRAIDPVIDPFVAGVRSEIDPVAYKAAGIAGGVALGTALMIFGLGYWWGKSRAKR